MAATKKKKAPKASKTRKKPACGPTKHCSDYGRRLATEHSSPAGKGLSRVCKPEKSKRKKRGCLNGTPKGYVEVLVRIPKAKLRKV